MQQSDQLVRLFTFDLAGQLVEGLSHTHTHTHTHACTQTDTHTHTHTHAHARACTQTDMCAHTYTHTCTRTRAQTNTHAHTCACMHVHANGEILVASTDSQHPSVSELHGVCAQNGSGCAAVSVVSQKAYTGVHF